MSTISLFPIRIMGNEIPFNQLSSNILFLL